MRGSMHRMPGSGFGPGGFMPPSRHPYPNRDGGRPRGMHPHDDDPSFNPPPIIKNEELEEFQPVPVEADGWATSAADIDYK